MDPPDIRQSFDVVIVGGGLAGLCLARQIRLGRSDLSILVLEKARYPVPEGAHKVGESTTEASALYLAEHLELHDYLERRHLRKFGFRYFWTHVGDKRLKSSYEIGLSDYFAYPSFQIDRGRLENDLKVINETNGIRVLDSAEVTQVALGDGGPHMLLYRRAAGRSIQSVSARWLVDASGRRSILQRALGLRRRCETRHSATWFRVPTQLDLSYVVPRLACDWATRVRHSRYNSTIHVMGTGYWIWGIPLSSGMTSVGIVYAEDIHSGSNFSTKEKMLAWLGLHEPEIHGAVIKNGFVDLLRLRGYSYSSAKIFSADRWACIGDAAVFSDPFYSPGSEIIAYENCIVSKMINLDYDGDLTTEIADEFSKFVLQTNDRIRDSIQRSYAYMGHPNVMAMKFVWDTAVEWGIEYPTVFGGAFLERRELECVTKTHKALDRLASRVEDLLQDWSSTAPIRGFDFIDYRRLSFLEQLYSNSTAGTRMGRTELLHEEAMDILRKLALAIFLIAAEDTAVEERSRLHGAPGLNPLGISLRPSCWETDGLFRPLVSRSETEPLVAELRGLWRRPEPASVRSTAGGTVAEDTEEKQ